MLLKKKFIHPDTQDVLSLSEWISWQIQGVIRNWWFVGIWTSPTSVWWSHPRLFNDPTRLWWNLCASWLAVTVELIIGIAMIGQTKRDAMIIRHILKLEKTEIEHLEDVLEDLHEHHEEKNENRS